MRIAAFDLETAGVDEMHSFGPGFVRLGAVKFSDETETRVTTDPRELVSWLDKADAVTGANICNFDNLALAKYAGADYEKLCSKSWDSQITEMHLDPVAARGAQPKGYHGLDQTAVRYGAPAKTDDIKKLARKHGGFHRIPQDDPDYNAYLRGDTASSEGVFHAQKRVVDALPIGDRQYIRREHRVAAVMGRIQLEGIRVDVDETMRRWSANQAQLEAGKQKMHTEYGMPLEGAKPQVSNLGKVAFRRALLDTGISEAALDANWPLNADGSLSIAKDVLNRMIEVLDRSKPAAANLCRIILEMNGVRSVPGTVLDHLVGDRVHPYIGADQGSGRWSMKKPGFTVTKKSERGLFLADNEDEVLCAIDADQIDARMVAALSGDREYAKLFEPGRDLHSEVSWQVFRNPACRAEMDRNNGRCDCPLRQRAKQLGHGFNYSMQANAMVRNTGVDKAVAVEFIRGMTEAFPVLAEWKEQTRLDAGALGYQEDAPEDDAYRILRTAYGRPVRVERNRAFTQATGLIGQGSTRDGMAEAALNLPADVRRRIRAVIHDEFVFSIPKEGAQETAQKIADSMAFEIKGVPITFGCSPVSRHLAGCYGYDK